MSFLNAVINKVEDDELREQFQERVDLVQHKIKFMEKVAVACLNTDNLLVRDLEGLISDAGGELQDDVSTARVVIYYEPGCSILQLTGAVPGLLDATWPAVQYSRVYLWDDQAASTDDVSVAVNALEDLAEMLYPGYFVFGNEGRSWVGFRTQ